MTLNGGLNGSTAGSVNGSVGAVGGSIAEEGGSAVSFEKMAELAHKLLDLGAPNQELLDANGTGSGYKVDNLRCYALRIKRRERIRDWNRIYGTVS